MSNPVLTTLVSFNGADGAEPTAGLIADAAGDLFGTTSEGGANKLDGEVFEIVKTNGVYASTPTVLASFNGKDGGDPDAGLIADAAGDLFGTTSGGGANNDGVVFEIAKTNGVYASTPTVLASFNGANGEEPVAGLIADAAGDLFGTTVFGGAYGDGVLFEIAKTNGVYASTPTVLASLNGADGEFPEAGLIADAAGDLFGTTADGGANNDGVVFEIAKTNGVYASTPTVLVSFNGTDGRAPLAGLISDAAGDLFGTASGGGANGGGVVFEIVKTNGVYASTPKVLASFNGTDGEDLAAGLIADAAGDLFGTTLLDGANGVGVLFEIAKTSGVYASTPTVLASFNGADGENPDAGLIADAAGDLFGTTQYGGANGDGVVFEALADPGPALTSTPPAKLGDGQSVGIGTVTPGLSGDSETLTIIRAPSYGTLALANGIVTYTETATVPTGGEYDRFSYAIADQVGNVSSIASATIDLDPGPMLTSNVPLKVGHGQTVSIGIVAPGLIGDSETLTVTNAPLVGTLALSQGTVTYTAPSNVPVGGLAEHFDYVIVDQLGDGGIGAEADFNIDPGPVLTSTPPAKLGHGQVASIGTVTAGLIGDTETLTLVTAPSYGTLSLNNGTVTYLATNSVPVGGEIDGFSYKITDQLGDVSTAASASIDLDPGPVLTSSVPLLVGHGQTVRIGTVAPGLIGDSETLTVELAPTFGALALSNGSVTYTAPSAVPVGGLSDNFDYVIVDQLGDGSNGVATGIGIDPGPALTSTPPTKLDHGQTATIGTVTAGVIGDTETLTTLTAPKYGALALSNGIVTYTETATVPTGGESDSFSYEITDQLGDVSTTAFDNIALDQGPTLTSTDATSIVTTSDEQEVSPFTSVSITDPNTNQTETATVSLGATNGTLSDSRSGTVSAGVYSVSGSAATVAADLDALVFTPTAHQAAPGSAISTTVTANISDTVGETTQLITKVTATAVNDKPVISGTVAGQTTNDTTKVKPFATATVSDVDTGVQDALIILVTNSSGVATDADGTLSGGGISETSTPGLYSIAAESPSSLTTALQSLVFTPSREEVTGTSTLITNFELIAVQQGGGGAVVTTTDTTTSLTVTQPLVFDGPAGGFGTIEGTSQPALIQAFGYVNTIYANGGNDSITTGSGNATVYTGGGSDSIILGGFFNTISGGDGSHGIYAVSADSGNDTVLGGSGNNTVVFGNGSDTVEIGGSGNLVNVGNGTDTIDLSGSNNTVKAGSPVGTDTIILGTASGGGAEQVMGGNGTFSVTVGGTGDIVTLGNGNNLVFATQGMAFITTGAGNDTITLGGSGSTVNAGGGTNFIAGSSGGDTFVLPVAGAGFDFIANFTTGNSDVLDLIPALAATNWNGQANSLGNYVQVADAGGSVVISISPTGSGASVGIAVLEGAGNLGLNNLLSHLQT